LENLSLTDDLTGLYNEKGFLALAEIASSWPIAPAEHSPSPSG